ncbi:hypothetical protein EBT23_01250 [bacterium]|nr:hypothetical protein [bacterium]
MSRSLALLPWAYWVLVFPLQGQIEEVPAQRAEAVSEGVRAAEPHQEPVRKAERAVKPPTNTGAPIHAGHPVRVVVESPKEGEVMPWETVDVFVRAENYAIGDGGNRLHVILDNGSPIEHANELKPVVLHGLAPGAHVLRIFAVKPDGKMLADPEASVRLNFYVRLPAGRPPLPDGEPTQGRQRVSRYGRKGVVRFSCAQCDVGQGGAPGAIPVGWGGNDFARRRALCLERVVRGEAPAGGRADR